KSTHSLTDDIADNLKAKCAKLLKALGEKDLNQSVQNLNKLIDEMNLYLRAPYPTFASDTLENFVKNEIVAFEHFLWSELKANHLTVQQEAPLFNDSLHLWEKVGTGMTPKEALMELSTIVARANKLLPESERYPFPDESDETSS